MAEDYSGPAPVQDPQPDWIDFKQIFTVGAGHEVWVLHERAGVFGAWELIGGASGGDLLVDRYRTSPTTVFIRDRNDWTARFTQPVAGGWSPWQSLDKPPGPTIAYEFAVGHVVGPTDDHLELFALNPTAGLWRRRQQGTTWTAWESLPLPPELPRSATLQRLAVGRMPAGGLVIFILDENGAVWMKAADDPAWTAVVTGPGGVPPDPVYNLRCYVDWGNNMALLVFATTASGVLKYKVSTSPTALSDWRQLDTTGLPAGGVIGAPAFMAGAVGVTAGGTAWVSVSSDTRTAGTWSSWQSLGRPVDRASNWISGLALALDSREDVPHPGLVLFAGVRYSGLWTRKQSTFGGPWGPWTLIIGAPPPVTAPSPSPRPRPLPIPLPGPLPLPTPLPKVKAKAEARAKARTVKAAKAAVAKTAKVVKVAKLARGAKRTTTKTKRGKAISAAAKPSKPSKPAKARSGRAKKAPRRPAK